MKRIFVIVLDSLGIGEMPDANLFNDCGSNTLFSLYNSGLLSIPCLENMGIFDIDGNAYAQSKTSHTAAVARMFEASKGKDTTVGHWEIMGLVSEKPFPTYPNGFPREILDEFEQKTGKKVLCNKPYSGTQVILDYGEQHEETGDLIVYTSGDSVFQIAAKEKIVPLDDLYKYCHIARDILTGEHAVGRVIARPFIGTHPNYTRTPNRHDYSVVPPKDTALDYIKNAGLDVISVGKISDIFSNKGITQSFPTKNNKNGMETTSQIAKTDFHGLCFVNLVDFDSAYGHRNDTKGYACALNEFDYWLTGFIKQMKDEDVLFITADHGCDPETESTDHSREYTPLFVYGKTISPKNLGTLKSFSDIGKTVLDILEIPNNLFGESFYSEIKE